MPAPSHSIPRIDTLTVKNFRVLQDVTLKGLSPLTVLTGPNGSGKSTIFDVMAFLSECFNDGLRRAWEKRGRMKELRSRGSSGPIEIQVKYRESSGSTPITYAVSIDERRGYPYVASETLKWSRKGQGRPFAFLQFSEGRGEATPGDEPDRDATRMPFTLDAPDLLAVNALGQFEAHPRVAALRRFISGWHLSYLSATNTRSVPESGPQERLNASGDNLPNVLQFLSESRPGELKRIVSAMRDRVPGLDDIEATVLADGRLMLRVKDGPFEEPVLARFVSDGTLKLLAYLVVLYDESPPPMIGIEEPENQLHPWLLAGLAEECSMATKRTQLLVTTHSPEFVEAVTAQQLWIVERALNGFARVVRATDIPLVRSQEAEGANLGQLWREGMLGVGEPRRGLTK